MNAAPENPTAIHTNVNIFFPRLPLILRSGRSSKTDLKTTKSAVEITAARVVKRVARKEMMLTRIKEV